MIERMMDMELVKFPSTTIGEESLVWWLHALDARWARNCDVPVGHYWARSP